MKRQAIFTVLWVAPIAILCGCAEDTGGEWTTEVWPESTVQANYCTEMPHDDLEEPEVVREGEDTWAINYPVFREGCGAYQLTGTVQFSSERPTDSVYYYTANVCNRCEKTHAIYSLGGPVDIGDYEIPASLKKLPASPEVETVDTMPPTTGPVVEHLADGETTSQENVACTVPLSGERTSIVINRMVSYEEVDRFQIEPDETVSSRGFGRFTFPGSQLLALAKESIDSTRLQWPRILPQTGPIDGRIAASRGDYCAVTRDSEAGISYGRSLTRAYDVPYDVDKKYVTQTVAPPTLPDELVKRLEEGAQK